MSDNIFKRDTKMFKELSKYRVKCKCSHTMIMTNADRMICSFCGRWVYRNPQIEFKYKMNKLIKGDKQ